MGGPQIGEQPNAMGGPQVKPLSQTEAAIPTNRLPFDQKDTQGDTGVDFYDTVTQTMTPDGGYTDATTNLFENTDLQFSGDTIPQTETARKVADYYSTGAGRDGATTPNSVAELGKLAYDDRTIDQRIVDEPNLDAYGQLQSSALPADNASAAAFLRNRPTKTTFDDSRNVMVAGTPIAESEAYQLGKRGVEAVGSGLNYVWDLVKGDNFTITPEPIVPVAAQTPRPYDSQRMIEVNKIPEQQPVAAQSLPGKMVGTGRPSFPSSIGAATPRTFIPDGVASTPSYAQMDMGEAGRPLTPEQQMGDAFGSGNVFTDPRQAEQAVKNLSDPNNAYVKKVAADQKKRLQDEDTARKLAAEEAAANAKQNNAFQNAANELFKNDNKEYRGGVLYSTAGKNAGKRINTAYMDAANLGTPNDDLKYVDGILRDKNGKGEAVNNAFQKMANLLTKSDGREYRGGKLIDEDTGYAYVDSYQNKDRSVDRNNPTGGINTSAEAMAANMAAFKQKFGSAGNSTNEDTKSGYSAAQLAAANQRNIAAGSATVNSRRTASDRANEAEQQANANAAVARSVRPKARPKARPTARPKSRNFGGSSQVRAEGGLIQKPTTTKKPAKAKTNKRGLAARK